MIFKREKSDPPLPDRASIHDWALFLDLDGTLIDLAPTPDAVVVTSDLIESLAALQRHLQGALAIISGRSLETIDKLLQPLHLAAAGEHGAAVRDINGIVRGVVSDASVPVEWRAFLFEAAKSWPGALVEEKPHGVAVHFRANPALESEVSAELARLVARDSNFEILPASMAREIRHKKVNKGAALNALMRDAPFVGRRPLFIGDDVTDEDAIAAAQALGGLGLRVPEQFGGQPSQVRSWLRDIAGKD